MGAKNNRPPLPAPTESLIDNNSGAENTDLATDVSRRTDRSSYSVPEDGEPLRLRTEKPSLGTSNSENSLLIEYYDISKSADSDTKKPTIRVKVTPHGKKRQFSGENKAAETESLREPSYTQRIPVTGSKPVPNPDPSHLPGFSSVEANVMQNASDISSNPPPPTAYVPAGSDVSSMPAESMLDGPPAIRLSDKQRNTHPENVEEGATASTSLKTPDVKRSRSKSKERITRKAVEKLTRELSPEPSSESRIPVKSKPRGSRDYSEEDSKARSRRSSKSHRDSGTDSSLLPPRDVESNISGASKVSLNNPRLVQLVEDSIRRIIIPELETIRRHQSVRSTATRDSYTSESSLAKSDARRRSHRSSGGLTKNRVEYDDHDSLVEPSRESGRRRKHRKSSQSSADSEATRSRRGSVDSIAEEKKRIHRSDQASRSGEQEAAKGCGTGLTKAALKSHDSRSSIDSYDTGTRERRKHGRSRKHSESDVKSDETAEARRDIPPLPMNSEIQDSELTRESLLSAESADSNQRGSLSSRTHAAPIHEVSRGSPQTVESPKSRLSPKVSSTARGDTTTPRRVRSDEESLTTSPRNDRPSHKIRDVALAAAGLGGAAVALYAEKGKDGRTRSTEKLRSTSRDRSPASQRRGSNMDLGEKKKPRSKESMKSSNTTERSVNSKRHPGVSVEEAQGVAGQDATKSIPRRSGGEEDPENFYEQQRKINDEYRSSGDFENQLYSATVSSGHPGRTPGDSEEAPSFGKVTAGQELQGIGANPEFVQNLNQPESAVASLIEPSAVSSQSAPNELNHKSDIPSLQKESPNTEPENHPNQRQGPWLHEHGNSSAERWNALRDFAEQRSSASPQKASAEGSPRQSVSQSEHSEERVNLGASAEPDAHDPLPEFVHGMDSPSEAGTSRSLDQKEPSILEGPLGDEAENRGIWPPFDNIPTSPKRGGFVAPDSYNRSWADPKTAALADAAGLGIGTTGAGMEGNNHSQQSLKQQRSQSSAELYDYGPTPSSRQGRGPQGLTPTPANYKDEGYASAAHPRSPDAPSPISFSKPPPKLFDESGYESGIPTETPSSAKKHSRHISGNSHGMPSEAYDAATGVGINNIQSRDVVALMDHLTVRDGHRNARDTEILVTLVRTAAEMRDSFEDMKKFVETQNKLNVSQAESQLDRTVHKAFTGPRRHASDNLKGVRSSSSSDKEDTPGKKKNIFKRALTGLSSRNDRDLRKMEDMLMQLLEEVETLKDVQSVSQPGQMTQQQSLDSYERLRAAPESGYEPEGQAGTSSTPSRSGMLSSPASRSGQRMHSGYDMGRDSVHRISTVPEADEATVDNSRYENDDGLLTPTQEAPQRQAQHQDTPSTMTKGTGSNQYSPNTPRGPDQRDRQKSTSSSAFGTIPRISRWSKTTTSSIGPERSSFQKDRPYSEASRSDSEVNAIPDENEPYPVAEQDRRRYVNSLVREDVDDYPLRSPSPLIPDSLDLSAEDPKYRANRHSLTLEHPQPRQGSTHRHQYQLEAQAHTFDGETDRSTNSMSDISQTGADAFGSVPALARMSKPTTVMIHPNKGRPRNASPLSKNRGGSFSRSEAPPRPPKVKDDGPLVPPPRPSKEAEQQFPSEQRRSIESDQLSAEGPCDSTQQEHSRDGSPYQYEHEGNPEDGYEYEYDDDDDGDGEWIEPIPLPRKLSPYSPGGLLAPIEERYSQERTRSEMSSPLKEETTAAKMQRFKRSKSGYSYEKVEKGGAVRRRSSRRSNESERIDEEPEGMTEDRAATPTQTPSPAVGAQTVGSDQRKLTGPREMPGGRRVVSGGRTASSGSQGGSEGVTGDHGVVRGTIRRKPAPGGGP